MNPEAQKKLADQVAYEKLEIKVARMRQLVPIDGFYKAYFDLLKASTSNLEAFNKLNDEYFELFGVYRYSSYESFKKLQNRYLKK